MNLNTYNICDDWGWYVDIENNNIIHLQSYNDFIFHENNNSNFILKNVIYFCKFHNINNMDRLYKISSTTIATFVVTYIVWVFI